MEWRRFLGSPPSSFDQFDGRGWEETASFPPHLPSPPTRLAVCNDGNEPPHLAFLTTSIEMVMRGGRKDACSPLFPSNSICVSTDFIPPNPFCCFCVLLKLN